MDGASVCSLLHAENRITDNMLEMYVANVCDNHILPDLIMWCYVCVPVSLLESLVFSLVAKFLFPWRIVVYNLLPALIIVDNHTIIVADYTIGDDD